MKLIEGFKYNPDFVIGNPRHTTHFACDEVLAATGSESSGCCCTGHVCRDRDPEIEGTEAGEMET
jgi:hypothetical protein